MAFILSEIISGVILNLLSMNPENRGEHIQLRHSYLWRNTMFKPN
jgi:hypothetical protein